MPLADEIRADLKKMGGADKPMPPKGGAPLEPAGDDEGGDYAGDEETAMQEFEEAATPAEKVAALKSFMSICYPQLASKEE